MVANHRFVGNQLEISLAIQENILVLRYMGAHFQYPVGYLGGTSGHLAFSAGHQHRSFDRWFAIRRIFLHDFRDDVGVHSCLALEKIF